MVDETDFVAAARLELERAATDLERLTGELYERSLLATRLEILADALLDLLPVPAIVVDPDGRIAAVSRGAVATVPALSDGLGRPASKLLPKRLADDVASAVSRARAGQSSGVDDGGAPPRFRALPDGSILVVIGGDDY